MTGIVGHDPDRTTPWRSEDDDAAQMLAMLEALNRGDDQAATVMADGLTLERRVHALSNISRILIQLVQNETGADERRVFDAVRAALLAGS